MKIGVHLPQWGTLATRQHVLEVARTAERVGFDSVWVADHIVHPTASITQYPYRAKGVPFRSDDGFLEAITVLAVVAGATERIGLGTSVLVLPMREPLLAAKTLATLDVLASGRTQFAIGSGWWQEEFDAIGSSFADRGRRLDEQLTILRRAWSAGTFSFVGRHYAFDEVACLPLPSQPSGPPLLIGGNGPAAWRRAAHCGDGWHAVGASVSLLADGRAEIDRLARGIGREPSEILLSSSCGLGRSPGETVERLGALAEVGVGQVVINFGTVDSADALLVALESFAANVRPQLAPAETTVSSITG